MGNQEVSEVDDMPKVLSPARPVLVINKRRYYRTPRWTARTHATPDSKQPDADQGWAIDTCTCALLLW